jgi:hypothetical protein
VKLSRKISARKGLEACRGPIIMYSLSSPNRHPTMPSTKTTRHLSSTCPRQPRQQAARGKCKHRTGRITASTRWTKIAPRALSGRRIILHSTCSSANHECSRQSLVMGVACRARITTKNGTKTILVILDPSGGDTTASTFPQRDRSSVCVVRLLPGRTASQSSRCLPSQFLSL